MYINESTLVVISDGRGMPLRHCTPSDRPMCNITSYSIIYLSADELAGYFSREFVNNGDIVYDASISKLLVIRLSDELVDGRKRAHATYIVRE